MTLSNIIYEYERDKMMEFIKQYPGENYSKLRLYGFNQGIMIYYLDKQKYHYDYYMNLWTK